MHRILSRDQCITGLAASLGRFIKLRYPTITLNGWLGSFLSFRLKKKSITFLRIHTSNSWAIGVINSVVIHVSNLDQRS